MNERQAASAIDGLVVVGGGMMGRAICDGLVAAGTPPALLTVAEPDASRRAALGDAGYATVASATEAVPGARTILLAVKPQVFPRVATELHGRVPDGALVLSIMAGVSTGAITAALSHASVARAMPNTAARVRQAVSVWYATPAVTGEQHLTVATVLAAIGEAIEVADEAMLDPATAVSGSGPAYICLVAEAMIEGAVAVGFSREVAKRLVSGTIAGTAALLREPGAHPTLIREGVTSPAGTTAAGLQALESRAVRAAFMEAIEAALRRARELGSPR